MFLASDDVLLDQVKFFFFLIDLSHEVFDFVQPLDY